MRARSLTGTSHQGVRRLRLSRIHVPLQPTYTSYGAVRIMAGHARIRVWKLKQFGSLLRSGSVRKESLRHLNDGEPQRAKRTARPTSSKAVCGQFPKPLLWGEHYLPPSPPTM